MQGFGIKGCLSSLQICKAFRSKLKAPHCPQMVWLYRHDIEQSSTPFLGKPLSHSIFLYAMFLSMAYFSFSFKLLHTNIYSPWKVYPRKWEEYFDTIFGFWETPPPPVQLLFLTINIAVLFTSQFLKNRTLNNQFISALHYFHALFMWLTFAKVAPLWYNVTLIGPLIWVCAIHQTWPSQGSSAHS